MSKTLDLEIIELTIDGIKVTGRRDETILTVAERNGIHIPTLCTYDKLTPTGACRVCVVDIGRKDRLESACTTPVTKGMVVETKNERVLNSRRNIVKLMLDSLMAPVESLVNKGDNTLLDLTYELGIPHERETLIKTKRNEKPLDNRNPVVIRDPNKCVMCGRCVNACNDHRGYKVLNFDGRGYEITITAGANQHLLESGCASCGECAIVCPTGAFSILERSLVQEEIDEVIKNGVLYPATSLTHANRKRLSLPPLCEYVSSDLETIIEKANLIDQSEVGKESD